MVEKGRLVLMKTMLITGAAGFIGSNFAKLILSEYPDFNIIVYDKLTYAGNLENLKEIENDTRYKFVKGDICDKELIRKIFRENKIDYVVNFAAETHVDRSIGSPEDFIRTDVLGTYVLLEAVKEFGVERFLQISTDEVYGSIDEGSFNENSPLIPSSPYSASKSGGDLLVNSYFVTYKLPVIITRSSNNYGPNQYPEKIIPLFITNLLEDTPVPVYGDGMNVRDWIYVEDNCRAVAKVLFEGKLGEVYNISSNEEKPNILLTKTILEILGKSESLINYVKDRPGHDRRYSIDASKVRSLGWKPEIDFKEGIEKTVQWYIDNKDWWKKIKSGEFKEYYKQQYVNR